MEEPFIDPEENLFVEVQKRIAEKLPKLSLIDEDYGQLETNEDTYPVTFPCCLINVSEIDWTEIGLGFQKGAGTIVVRLAIDCYDDTHYGSGTEGKSSERLQLKNKLYRALQGFAFCHQVSRLVRIKGRNFSLSGAIKVYEMTFRFNADDKSAMAKD